MTIKKTILAMAVSAVACSSTSAIAADNNLIYFDNTNFPSDVTGSLKGTVKLAQNIIMPTVNKVRDEITQHPVGHRDTLVMFKAQSAINFSKPLKMVVYGKEGRAVYSKNMDLPYDLPKTSMQPYIEEPAKFDYVIDNPEEVASLYAKDPKKGTLVVSQTLNRSLAKYDSIKIVITDDANLKEMALPRNKSLEGKKIVIEHNSSNPTEVHYRTAWRGLSFVASKDRPKFILANYSNTWYIVDGDYKNVRYGKYWSARIPARHVEPGMKVRFFNGQKSSILNDLDVGADTLLVGNVINMGMLVSPTKYNRILTDHDYQRQYFQHIPVSRMIIPEYEPVQFNDVSLATGELYTPENPSKDKGSAHSGDMRGWWGKFVVSLGINLANYGRNSSQPNHEFYNGNQITAHKSRGLYSNGVVHHGYSGGSSMVTLASTIGSEWGHELGHNFGAGHYPGGVYRYTQNQPANVNSTWVWDKDKNYFIDNFNFRYVDASVCARKTDCVQPWRDFYSFSKDPMAASLPTFEKENAYTSHTPYVLSRFQAGYERRFNLDKYSPTGFTKWNDDKKRMEPYVNIVEMDTTSKWLTLDEAANTNAMKELFKHYDQLNFFVRDGRWTRSIELPAAKYVNVGSSVEVSRWSGYGFSVVGLGGDENEVEFKRGETKYFVSDGEKWVEDEHYSSVKPVVRVPLSVGGEVTTLVGHYDPENKLNSHIGRPMYGSWGVVYDDQNSDLAADSKSCHLEVKFKKGDVSKFRLHNNRFYPTYMNKFHVNVPTSSENPAKRAIIRCNGKVLAKRYLEQRNYEIELTTGENGISERQMYENSSIKEMVYSARPYDVSNKSRLQHLLSRFDFINFKAADGHWTRRVNLPSASQVEAGKTVLITRKSQHHITVQLSNEQNNEIFLRRNVAYKFVSNGSEWVINEK